MYNKKINYCGHFCKFYNKNINYCCYKHDLDFIYRDFITANKNFLDCMLKNGAYFRAVFYTLAVSSLGFIFYLLAKKEKN